MTNSSDSAVDGPIRRLGGRRTGRAGRGAANARAADGGIGKSADLLDLTGRAKELRTLQGDLAKSPEFDLGRVREIKAALASGLYKVNAERIAEKLLAMEAMLP